MNAPSEPVYVPRPFQFQIGARQDCLKERCYDQLPMVLLAHGAGGVAAILFSWALIVIVFLSIGLACQRLFGVDALDLDSAFGCFWMGFSAAILFLQLWHLAWPVNDQAVMTLGAIAAIALIMNRRVVLAWARERSLGDYSKQIVVLLVITLLVANVATGPCSAYDSGMYHLQVVRWATTYRIVPGLANLDAPLGFNNTSLLYAAMFGAGPWSGHSTHFANSLLLLVCLAQAALVADRLRCTRPSIATSAVFRLALVPPLVGMVWNGDYVSSITTDAPAFVLIAVAASGLFELLVVEENANMTRAYKTVCVATWLVVAACTKLSLAPFAGVAFALNLAWWWRTHGSMAFAGRTAAWIAAIATALGAAWIVRGIILSGYPFYPSSFAAMPVDWRVSAEQMRAEAAWVQHAARWYYNLSLLGSGWAWIPGWVSNTVRLPMQRLQIVVPALLAAACVAAWLGLRTRRAATSQLTPGTWLLVPLGVGVAVWIVQAPDPRFGAPFVWILAALAQAEVLGPRFAGLRRRGLVAATLFAWALLPVLNALPSGGFRVLTVLVRPPAAGYLHSLPFPNLTRIPTHAGLVLYTPVEGQLCWDGPLPCTPRPALNLHERQPGQLGAGFAIDGAWDPVNWPRPKSQFRTFLKRQSGSR